MALSLPLHCGPLKTAQMLRHFTQNHERVCLLNMRPRHRNPMSQVYEGEFITPVSVGDTGPIHRLPRTRFLTSAEHARAGHETGEWRVG